MIDQTDQTDQTPTVTDEAIRRAHEWCDLHWPTDENRTPMADVIRHYRATVPAPPATLAAELRYRATLLYNGDPDGDSAAVISALADRVETVEKERDKAQQDAVDAWEHAAQTDRDHVRAMGLWEQDYARVAKERDEARAEVRGLTTDIESTDSAMAHVERQRDEARAELVRISDILDGGPEQRLEDTVRKWRHEAEEAHAEVERLTRESAARLDQIKELESKVSRMVATGSTYPSDALPDPADYAEEHANDQ
ncbi:hypothetical protein [Corynebacterium sp. AOP12-C2-36]|uniref:hypothetical protein n=1 Tax=Corynebacterium sp. AOP12-C2-36 TaxID=3457723 RepID=UPI00403464D1